MQNLQFYVKSTSRLKQKNNTYSFFMHAKFTNLRKINQSFKANKALFFRAHMNTAQNQLKIAPRGIMQGVFAARRRTEKNAVKNENLVM